jgi:hypothetical protein
MTARDKWTVELKTQAIETLQRAIGEVADRIERGLENGVDRQYVLEGALWELDQITGREYVRGQRITDPRLDGGS